MAIMKAEILITVLFLPHLPLDNPQQFFTIHILFDLLAFNSSKPKLKGF
jgi:hypothetical protein